MPLVLFGSTAVDPVDVALVVPNDAYTPAGSTLYLADGQLVTTATAPAAVAAAIDAFAGASWLTAPIATENYPTPCYIGGPNVQRVSGFTRGVVDGSQVFMRSGPGPVICPTVDVAAMVALVDATSGGGGGGDVAYTDAGQWALAARIDGPGNTSAWFATPMYQRSGQVANAPDPDEGDVETISFLMRVNILDTDILDVTIVNLPAPLRMANGMVAVFTVITATGSIGTVLATAIDSDTIQFTSSVGVTGNTTVFITARITYLVDAV